ncbi:Penicillin-binding protein H [Solibacillus isronensis B3W22]|uniref:Penicillin-binding protein H n=1 Tax=Solibacillus isronensis B3W22 TaxID=1224748 RepID=K1KHM4_9BACL|nr:penicillin-binding protein 2 [Solibacillus isronensis]AMO86068.1 penicillin-binding protein [Solibacillus silvestris]EKB43600.1 Penicillin-binding protein H [Solibacillus isronensis B3W22]
MRKITQNRQQNPKAKQRASLTFRMNILFFSIFVLFSVLIFRLGYIQIVKGEDYVRALERTEEVRVNTSVPRGRIFDRYGRILVDNQPENAITYTKMQTTKSAEMLEIAEKLANLIEQPTEKVTQRDKLDFWILRNPEKAKEKVTQKEMTKFQLENEELETKEINKEYDRRIRDRITDEELEQLTDFDLEVLAIYREMMTGYNLSPQIIKGENVTPEEFARVSEQLADLPGVNTTTDWKRVRLSPLAVLGRTTVPSKGVPKSKLNHYLARDYSRNDRVGESYFEAQYEEILQGEKSVVKNITNKKGQVVETMTTFAGEPGKDLVTTIDVELQQKADEILEKYLLELKAKGGSQLLDRGFLVAMDPKTGELLSVVGKKIEKDEETGKPYIVDYSYGTFTSAYEAGSTVKAATVLMGYNEGIIKPGTVLLDSPMRIGNITLNTLFNKNGSVMVSDLTALERSSNVYMFKIAMGIGGRTYSPGMRFSLAPGTLQTMRNEYAQFGLGVPTGIDLPGESTGYQADPDTDVKLLNLAIGQFDTYTTMQLAQYISTIANGGYRIQPRMLKEIRNPSKDGEYLGQVVEEVTPNILNKIENSQREIEQVQEGLRRVYFGANGSARRQFETADYTAAGKTGTAEVVYYGPQRDKWKTNTINIVHVGYAPFDDPEIAYAVIFPWATTNFTNNYLPQANLTARELVDSYFELKNKYAEEGLSTSKVEKPIIKHSDEKLDEDEEVETVNE